jgi:hypothetical protein
MCTDVIVLKYNTSRGWWEEGKHIISPAVLPQRTPGSYPSKRAMLCAAISPSLCETPFETASSTNNVLSRELDAELEHASHTWDIIQIGSQLAATDRPDANITSTKPDDTSRVTGAVSVGNDGEKPSEDPNDHYSTRKKSLHFDCPLSKVLYYSPDAKASSVSNCMAPLFTHSEWTSIGSYLTHADNWNSIQQVIECHIILAKLIGLF